MKLSKVILLLAGVTVSMGLQAREFADIYTECGLGAMIAPNNEAVAAVTNVTWDLGTTAISSNSSSPDSCQGGSSSAAAFIYDAYPSLEKDLAAGQGEHLTALLTIAQCDASAQTDIGLALRKDFGELVSDDGYSQQSRYENAEGLYNALMNRVAGVCAIS